MDVDPIQIPDDSFDFGEYYTTQRELQDDIKISRSGEVVKLDRDSSCDACSALFKIKEVNEGDGWYSFLIKPERHDGGDDCVRRPLIALYSKVDPVQVTTPTHTHQIATHNQRPMNFGTATKSAGAVSDPRYRGSLQWTNLDNT